MREKRMHFIENHSRLVTFSELDEDKSLVPILAFLSSRWSTGEG